MQASWGPFQLEVSCEYSTQTYINTQDNLLTKFHLYKFLEFIMLQLHWVSNNPNICHIHKDIALNANPKLLVY